MLDMSIKQRLSIIYIFNIFGMQLGNCMMKFLLHFQALSNKIKNSMHLLLQNNFDEFQHSKLMKI